MSLPDPSTQVSRPASRLGRFARAPLAARLALVCALSGALAGCFQPLYAENSTVGGPALMDKFRDVDVIEIRGRLGNDLRNDLIFALTGGSGNPKGAPLQLIIAVDTSTSTAIVNSSSGLPENQVIRVTANWRLVKAADDPKKVVIVTTGAASGTATIDTSDQRFANYSATIDAEKRAARGVADQIKAQLGAFFIRNPSAPGSAS
ncbi:LPS assembly lipoprotein LptE [Xanthobacter autotrophicus]|uniref:LPS assembly lipoprotein LptE n=1 Tax=Xanthobacter autotrophicus TaxID=280 RepID=UPI0024A625A8|nr:LPS assembly lipoprotein LptE [Xanthobacter autotrophicus]MDI4655939.1 LPS assembly lipoprotein LptE [Xanthobacter autotrophicus]